MLVCQEVVYVGTCFGLRVFRLALLAFCGFCLIIFSVCLSKSGEGSEINVFDCLTTGLDCLDFETVNKNE